ncbi:MAG: hypothetical protein Q7K55_08355 [Candidatus Levybacteria bacterium]|nr:hypothetical protein [Candidatus Levybacteria bacterium]
MNTIKNLPKVSKKKKIDLKKFVLLANKVRKSFEEEEKYLEKKTRRDENNNSVRFLPNI